jgi:hypothetical protein
MPLDLDRLPSFFAKWAAQNENRGAVGEVAQLLSAGSFSPTEFAEIVQRHGCAHDSWFHDAMLDLVLGYASERFAAGPPEIPDVGDLLLLQKALHIEEGQFFERRAAEVSRLIQEQFDAILADGVIDNTEDLYLVELQAAFQLSYDQLMILARPAIERAVTTLRTGVGMAGQWGSASRRTALEKLAALESTYRIATANHRTLGGLY